MDVGADRSEIAACRGRSIRANVPGMSTDQRARHSSTHRTRIAPGGLLEVPVSVWRRLGAQPGDELILVSEEAGFRVTTLGQAVREVETFLAGIDPAADVSPADVPGKQK